MRRFATAWVAVAVLVGGGGFVGSARSATVSVPCDPDALQNAVAAANQNQDADTLLLAKDCTYILPGLNVVGVYVVSPLTIHGHGATLTRFATGIVNLSAPVVFVDKPDGAPAGDLTID